MTTNKIHAGSMGNIRDGDIIQTCSILDECCDCARNEKGQKEMISCMLKHVKQCLKRMNYACVLTIISLLEHRFYMVLRSACNAHSKDIVAIRKVQKKCTA